MKTNHVVTLIVGILTGLLGAQQATAAIALDRTRVIFNGGDKSVSMNISNENKHLPYLAQGWIEDAYGKKITSPLTVLPPVQRLEPGAKSQVKVQGMPAASSLPQDRETLFYFNLREIPPKSDKPNTLQLALQTRIKLFYRPKAITVANPEASAPWQEKLTLTRLADDSYLVNNPTPYYVTLVDASSKKGGASAPGFEPLMVAPKGSAPLKVVASALGKAPVLTYVNDYGGRPQLSFNCNGAGCLAVAGSK
ncbi:fimbria/pilus periplasmic chaperone [Citrobacter sp. Awk 4]|uniref:fimbria/pilus periplasmic chaperone n=1 Tax=Citrobacter sp. Awk 4 TaxID=2963955 RepID=UPI002303596A|nr:fimbria/pilus periplasmic chaperone [Citrobacter sp. Awk 4]MDA8478794.1 fimbria/pilus periplasmic chaperone [Citrobacter sp. Awk 4]